jgi:hypothetical protein
MAALAMMAKKVAVFILMMGSLKGGLGKGGCWICWEFGLLGKAVCAG